MSARKLLAKIVATAIGEALEAKRWKGPDLARELTALMGRRVSPQTVNQWTRGRSAPSFEYVAPLQAALGVDVFARSQDPTPAAPLPRVGRKATGRTRREAAETAGTDDAAKPLDMKAVARQIAEALEQDLRKSEAVISQDAHEIERQRHLVWALKDLARWLTNSGYDMRQLFRLTDEMASEIGLPTRSKADGKRGNG